MTRLLAVLLALAASGCVSSVVDPAGPREARPERWEVEVEPSMAPDFSGMGDGLPVLLVHQHHVPSLRQKEEAERNPVVCLMTDGSDVPWAPREADIAAPCAGPAADPATGRVFVERRAFEEAAPRALVVFTDRCAGGVVFLGGELSELLVRTAAHDFTVRLHGKGTFTVDGRWVEPRTTLKVSYVLHDGDPQDEERVRVVFDAPGQWLRSRVGGDGEDVRGPDVPPRPERGTGLVVDVALAPPTLRAPLEAAVAATPGAVLGVSGMRAVHDGERLTELTLRLATDRGTVTWYGAGRTGDGLRLLGAEEPASDEPSVPPDALLAAFDAEWRTLRAGVAGTPTDVRLAPTVAWSSAAGLALAVDPALAPGGCEGGCVFARQDGQWGRVLVAAREDATDARTLRVLAHGADAPAELWWHAPRPA